MSDELTMELHEKRSVTEAQSAAQGERVAFVGQLAGAMGNQFNNLMMAVTGYAELELKKAAPPQKRKLEQILSQTALATTMVQKLLALSKRGVPAPRSFEFNPMIQDLTRLLKPLVGEDVEVSVKLDEKVGLMFADPIEVERLVLGLALQIRDAVGEAGQLLLSTGIVDLDSSSFTRGEAPKTGPYVLLTMRYGTTVNTAAERDRRTPGRRAGRVEHAIAIARGIVKDQGAVLRVSVAPEAGITFEVYFPAVPGEKISAKPHVAQTTAPVFTKTILLVEDDDGVRDPAAEFLKMEGFKVLQARTGREALRIVQDSRSKIDLLVTDILMAGMPGTDVADELLKTNPGLKVLYMSGDPERVAELGKQRSHPMLQKPFRLNVLNEKIRELMGE